MIPSSAVEEFHLSHRPMITMVWQGALKSITQGTYCTWTQNIRWVQSHQCTWMKRSASGFTIHFLYLTGYSACNTVQEICIRYHWHSKNQRMRRPESNALESSMRIKNQFLRQAAITAPLVENRNPSAGIVILNLTAPVNAESDYMERTATSYQHPPARLDSKWHMAVLVKVLYQ